MTNGIPADQISTKSRATYIALGLFLGFLGIHNFYAGHTGRGVLGLLTGGLCGFGLGATPNAMANMKAVCGKNGYSSLPFVVVPLVGAIFVDILNVTLITLFLNFIG